MKCPKCNSEQIQFVSNTTSKGFSNKSAATGCFCFGIPGLLFGLCNSGKKETSEFWICNNCGSKFQKADAEAKERKIQNCREIISGATKKELNDLLSYISKAESEVDAAEKAFLQQLQNEEINNKDMVKANKIRQIKIIATVVVGIICLIFFSYEESNWGAVFGIVFTGLLITLYKSKERIFDKYASTKLKELDKKRYTAKEKLERLEIIAKAQNDLQEMVG